MSQECAKAAHAIWMKFGHLDPRATSDATCHQAFDGHPGSIDRKHERFLSDVAFLLVVFHGGDKTKKLSGKAILKRRPAFGVVDFRRIHTKSLSLLQSTDLPMVAEVVVLRCCPSPNSSSLRQPR